MPDKTQQIHIAVVILTNFHRSAILAW